ncbi:DUF3829 domain-containing protein [Sphingomonas sp. HF-S4]|uniref:DUF3829 domain-containing protein n=1 Tax=Sphingomonas agrestis TaxID=3080540 RepID=A0ABU3Y1Y8_9SPHN|nr:DUF3829 domain-containing protein [Sphingomonas sp. HF-S4]MDV3455354.1 DUF3829 domain-containing protein [Sphingomonas sp. HF-S4]
MVLVLPMAGCGVGSEQRTSAEPSELSYEQSTKLSAYSRTLIDFDPSRLRREFAERRLDKATAEDSPFMDAQSVENAWEDLRRTRAMDGALKDIDPLADRLLAPLGRLAAKAKDLRSYLTMRGYLTDDFARARKEAPEILADYDVIIAATDALAKTVETSRVKTEAVLIKRLQGEGRMADVYELQIAQQVRKVRELAGDGPTLEPAVLDEMDKLLTQLTPLLDKVRTARTEEARKAGEDAVLDNGVVASAESMIGALREYRRSRDADNLKELREAASNVLRATA